MAYKIMQKDEDGVLREVVIRGEAVRGSDFDPGGVELKDFDDDTRSFSAVGSTGDPDRVEDIVDQKGWELDNFEKNPVGMWAHDYSQLPIFRVSDMEIKPRSKKMLFRANFDDFEFADNVYNSFRKGFMKGFSVGFLPLEYEARAKEDMDEEAKQRAGWWGGMHFKRQELLEISAAPIPMHPDALAGMKSMGISTEFYFSEDTKLTPGRSSMNDGSTWIPIDDVNSFVDIASIKLEDGVTAVSGKPTGKVDSLVIDGVVGYIFPRVMSDEDMVKWLVSNAISEEKAIALVTLDLDKYLELMIDEEEGTFNLLSSEEPRELVLEEDLDLDLELDVEDPLPVPVDDDIVKTEVDKPGEEFVIIPEGVRIEEDGLVISTSLGSLTIGAEILEKAGLAIREDELVDIRNRDSLDTVVNSLTALLKDVKIDSGELEPVPEPIAQQDEEGEEDFALLLTVAEELQTDTREAIRIDPEMFKSALNEVFKDEIGGLVKSSLTKSLKHVSGKID